LAIVILRSLAEPLEAPAPLPPKKIYEDLVYFIALVNVQPA